MKQAVVSQFALSFEKKKGKFTLSTGENTYQQNVCEFLLTNSYLAGKDVEEYLFSIESEFDNVRIPLTSTGKSITLSLVEFIRLKELYHQQMYMLKLEDVLAHRGITLANSL